MKNPKRLLLADNSSDYRHSLRGLLELETYVVVEAESPEEAEEKLVSAEINLALVDLRLVDDEDAADFSGLEIAKKATELHIPCIVITAFPSVEVARLALRSRGATSMAVDFVQKDNGPQAVLDAINVILKNYSETFSISTPDLKIDLDKELVSKKGEFLDLSRNQYALLAYLCKQEGAVCKPEELLKVVYDDDVSKDDAINDRRLERLVERLREKIEDDPSSPLYLVKVYGRGYRLDLDN